MTSSLSTQSNRFAFDLLSKCYSDSKNVVVSPFSLYNLLSLVANGARGTTQSEILAVLGTPLDALDELNKINARALDRMSWDLPSTTKVSMANGIFYEDGASIKQEFARLAVELYDAQIAPFDPNKRLASIERINRWASERTLGLIPQVLDPSQELAALVALNAIYFYGEWLHPFAAKDTMDKPFYLGNGESRNTKMMAQVATFEVSCRPSFCAIRLPYQQHLHALTVYLPNEGVTVESVLKSLDSDELNALERGFERRRCFLSLPKVLSKEFLLLNDVLLSMGIRQAFDPIAADFEGLLSGQFYFSKVFQKTFFELDEKGTEAAAVTVIEMRYGSAFSPPIENPVIFNVNRPFLFSLADRSTGAHLFAGIVQKPGG